MRNTLVMTMLAMVASFNVNAGQIRNFQTVIEGRVYRAGTTKQVEYNNTTLTELCEQGFTVAVFLYAGAKERTVSCSGGRSIHYSSITSWKKISPVTSTIGSAIRNGGKAIFHCWNGVHATGYIAAATLNQFCGFSGKQASTYFVNGVPKGSLAPSAISSLASILTQLPNGGSVMQGCPSAP